MTELEKWKKSAFARVKFTFDYGSDRDKNQVAKSINFKVIQTSCALTKCVNI